jgi:hypothetical protein
MYAKPEGAKEYSSFSGFIDNPQVKKKEQKIGFHPRKTSSSKLK